MIDSKTRGQFRRYVFVGLVSNLLLYLTYSILTALKLGPKTAMSLVYVSGVLLTFVANRAWSFNDEDTGHSSFLRYLIAYLLGYVLNFVLLWFGVDRLGLPHQGVQAVAIVVVAFSLFVIHKYWVFASAQRRSAT